MRLRTRLLTLCSLALLGASLLAVPATATESRHRGAHHRTYEVTIYNTSLGQPLSPPVVATHRRSATLFRVGRRASEGIVEIAENGNADPAATALAGNRRVTDVEVLDPIASLGTRSDLPTSRTVRVKARRGDRLSVAGMLICTNDGFAGVDRMRLPRHGSRTAVLGTYDAGSERNTEASADIVDPCSGLGPVDLAGDTNGNNNDGIDTSGRIRRHPGVDGTIGDLLPAHDWELAAVLTVRRVR